MKKYFKGTQPHITIDKIEAEFAFLPGTPERALEIEEKFSSYEKVAEQREFVTYKGKHGGRECDTGCCWCCELYLPDHEITQIFTREL
jgi:uridine phosphorylase